MLSYGNRRVVWDETEEDIRWPMRNFSVIKIYYLDEKRLIRTRNTRYVGAAVSSDGKKIVTTHVSTENINTLTILDLTALKSITGQYIETEVQEFPNPENAFYSMSRFSNDDSELISLKTTAEGKSLVLIDLETNLENEIIPSGAENISHPVKFNNYIFYNSPFNGIDNIYVIDIESGQKFQVTRSKYGSYNPAISSDGQTIYYNDFSGNGMDVKSTPFNPDNWLPVSEVKDIDIHYYQTVVDQEGNADLLDHVPSEKFGVKRYHKATGLIRPVGWGPLLSTTSTELFVGIKSRDLLSTTTMSAGYIYNADENTGKGVFRMRYQEFFPVFDFEFSYGNRSTSELAIDTTNTIFTINFDWTESTYKPGIKIPLNFTRSKYNTEFEFGNAIAITRVNDMTNDFAQGDRLFFDQLGEGILTANEFKFQFTNTLKRSKRDINPRFGQFMTFENFSTPYKSDFEGGVTAVRVGLYLPISPDPLLLLTTKQLHLLPWCHSS